MPKFWSMDLSKDTIQLGPTIVIVLLISVICSYDLVNNWLSKHRILIDVLLVLAILFVWLHHRASKTRADSL